MSRKIFGRFNLNNIGPMIKVVIGVLAICIVFLLGKQEMGKLVNRIATKRAITIELTATAKTEEEIQNKISQALPGIVCWGDSLTAGACGDGTTFPIVLENLVANHIYPITVINCGVGGEDTNTIIGRAGGVPFVITKPLKIPSDSSQVEIAFSSSNGSPVAPLRQGDCGVNPILINGIQGSLLIEQENYTSKEFFYKFSREIDGEAVEIEAGMEILTSASYSYNAYIPVIFIGQNGGWRDAEDLISQQMSIVNSQNNIQDRYIILGLTSGDAESRAELETAMTDYYGEKFINLRRYLSSNGMVDAGLIPTEQDLEAMKIGSVPPGLLSDSVHLNSYGYTIIGNLVYERMEALGYFNDVREIIQKDGN